MKSITVRKNDPITVTETEIKMLKCFSKGMPAKRVAEETGLTAKSIEGHLTRLRFLLRCANTTELCCLFLRKKIFR